MARYNAKRRVQASEKERDRRIQRRYYVAHKDTLNAQERLRAKTPARAAQKRKAVFNRRARKIASFVEKIDPLRVYEMHGGACGICKEFVPEDSFHVDHVVPLSKGGLHGYTNVVPAHAHCNLVKGAG